MRILAEKLGGCLQSAGFKLVTAESCTGGWAAQVATSIGGSSSWFERGFITYSDEAKREMLGVTERTLVQHGAVSEQAALEMAAGALARSKGSVSLAITGIAGPGGGSPAKPVGTVCFAWACRAGESRSETRCFKGDRESIRRQSVVHALEGVMRVLDSV
jgi:nicotinamide-nucleotide amidase